MNVILCALFVICWSIIIYSYAMLRRNDKVYAFRTGLLRRVSICAKLDIHAAVSKSDVDTALERSLLRFDVLASVPYNSMVFKLWKPLQPDAWWDDLSFMTPPSFYQTYSIIRKNESELRPWEH